MVSKGSAPISNLKLINFWHERPARHCRLVVVLILIVSPRQFHFVTPHFLMRHQTKQLRNTIQPRAPLVVGPNDVPRASFVSVASSIISRAREYAYQRAYDSRSIGLNFHWRRGSSIRASNRRCCSSWPTSSQNLIRMMPPLTMWLSNFGQISTKPWYCSFVQNPITYSTPARLYQLRSKMTTSPAAGNCCI